MIDIHTYSTQFEAQNLQIRRMSSKGRRMLIVMPSKWSYSILRISQSHDSIGWDEGGAYEKYTTALHTYAVITACLFTVATDWSRAAEKAIYELKRKIKNKHEPLGK